MLNSIKLLNTCINTVDSGICVIDQQGIIRMVNAALASLCEQKVEALEGSLYAEILPKDVNSSALISALIQGERDALEVCKVWWKAPERYKYIRGYGIDEESEELRKCRILFLKDVSDEVEHKNQLQYQASVLHNVQDSVIVTDMAGVITFWNDAATELFEYTAEEMIGLPIQKLSPEFDPKKIIDNAKGRRDYFLRIDKKYILRSGKEVWADVKLSMLYDENTSAFQGFIGVSKDITEKKKQEIELMRRTKELASLVESQTNFLVRSDIAGNYTFVNKRFLEYFGYDKSIIGKHFSTQIHPDDIEKSREKIKECVMYPGKAVPIELRRPKGDGTYYTNYWEFVGITNQEGEVIELQGIGYDITERKEAENKIKYLKSFNELLLEISADLINLNYHHLGERIMEALEDVTEFTGFDRAFMYLFNEDKSESVLQYEYYKEEVGPSPPETHRYPAKYYTWWVKKILKQETIEISDESVLPAEAESIRKELEVYGITSMITVPIAYQENVLGFVGFVSMQKVKNWDQDTVALLKLLGAILANVLYRTQTVQELEESHNRYKLLADHIGDVVLKHDLDYLIKFVTPSSQEMLGYSPDDLTAQSFAALVHPEDFRLIEEHVQQALAGNHIRFVTRLKKKNNTYLWVEVSAKAFENGGNTELIAVIRDIDIQKQIEIEKDELFRETHALNEELRASEEELRQTLDKTVELNDKLMRSEEKFKALTEKSFDGIVVYGPDASIKYISPSASKIIGYESQEALKMTGRDFIHPEDLPEADQKMASLIEQAGKRVSFEVRSIRKDGVIIWIETHITNLLQYPAIEGLVANFRDITDKKKAAIELEETRTSLNIAQKVAKLGSWEVDLETRETFLSDGFYDLLRIEHKKNTKFPLDYLQYVHPEDREQVKRNSKEVMEKQITLDSEYRIIDSQGQLKYIRSHSRFLYNETGKAIKIIGTLQDITKEKDLESLLEETSRLTKVGGWEVDLLTNELIWTKETYALHEIPFGQPLNVEEAINFYHPDDRPILEKAFQKMTTEGDVYDLELRIITTTGKLKWIRTTGGIVNRIGKKVIKVRGSIQDITERKLKEEEVKKYSERLTLATESAQIGIWDLDIRNNMLYWDRQTCRIFGVEEIQFQGKLEDLESLIYPSDLPMVPRIEDVQAWESNEMDIQFRIIRPDNQEVRHIKSSAKVLFDQDRQAIRMIGVHWDITSLKENEDRLERNNEELRKTNAELDHFVYSTSHNLRAPLTSVMGIVDILRESPTEEEREQFIELIKKSIYKLDETIQEINDYSKNARVEVQYAPIALVEIINNIAESLSFMQNAREMKLELNIPDKLEFYSDPGRIKIIFNNLLSNAVKYASPHQEHPFVSVTVEKKSKHIQILIKDNGIGIKEEHLNKIFDMFFRATNRSSGSGLGLYIVKEAVEKLGGEISVKSVQGQGTDFMIKLPAYK